MIPDLLHIPLAALACYFLWRLWRSVAGNGRTSSIVAAGLVIRALGGQALYWISYLGLPIARPLQLGGGFWFFAVDGPGMLANTRLVLLQGPMALLLTDNRIPSRGFIQVFTIFAWLFGSLSSVAILLNCAAYLATCALILRIGPRDPRTELARVVAIAAMALGPGTILWSLQLLKDTLFLFLIAAMVALCDYWQRFWRELPQDWKKGLTCAGSMAVVIYAIAGMRWYIAFFLWIIWPVFALLTTIVSRRKVAAALAHLLLFVVIGSAVRIGGGSDLPGSVRLLLDPRPTVSAAVRPGDIETELAVTRRGFENTHGATTIVAGGTLQRARIGDGRPASKPAALTIARQPAPRSPVRRELETAPSDSMAKQTAPGESITKRTAPVSPPDPDSQRTQKVAAAIVPHDVPKQSTRRSDVLTTTAAGLVATFLPRTLAQLLGLVQIGGGRGFWLFVELDTVVFDALLLFAIVFCIRGLRSGSRPTPVFFLLLLLFLATALPLAYTVNNFGTLFRMRQMLYVMLAFLPLTLAPRAREPRPESSHEGD